ncbi:FlgB family protein [Marinovum sp.]|uniref:FlgB family protein n=1 Tax=Marinovum sp. TaxID=2024839 RepID=UPI002B26C6DD|nr:FlgB family protein [Marinovum sp.]
MFDTLEVLQLSQAMARHAGARQAVAARNLAHADTPGYKARDLTGFPELALRETAHFGLRATRDSHLSGARSSAMPEPVEDAGAVSDPNGNSISLETEMLRAVDIRRQHDKALAVYRASLNILRSSLGRQ